MTDRFDVTREGWKAYALALTIIVIDQITKAWMLYGLHIRERGRIELSPIFDLTFVLNRGVSFGLFTSEGAGRWVLSLFSIAVAIGLAWWVRRADRPLFSLAVGSIMGGALGNVIDRIRFGGVVDFLDFSGLMFPWVFNVADSAITVGVLLLLADGFVSERRNRVGAQPAKE
ncbi:MAG TPA: signal peptidase II [Caulobacteraceae bacterium]|nr:signal peptidase II [Caulobacteraceae bacterium]